MNTIDTLFVCYYIMIGMVFSALVGAYAAHCSWMRSALTDQLMIINGHLYQVRLKYGPTPNQPPRQTDKEKESTMLKLTQSAGKVTTVTHQESGESIDIITLGVKYGQVRLGFDDPEKRFTVLRDDAIKRTAPEKATTIG